MTTANASTLRNARIALIAAILLAALAIWLRANRLTAWPMWLDEAYSAFAAEKGQAFIWTVLPGYETHPPLYSSVLSLWTWVAGTSLFGFRALGLLAGIATLPIIWAAGRELARNIGQDPRWLGLAALAIAAVSPALVDMARLIRPYYFMILVQAAGCWALLRIVRGLREDDRLPRFAFWIYVACLALLVWFHSLGALYAAALGLALIVGAGPKALLRHWKLWLAGHVVAALAVLPALLILADQAPTWTRSTWLAFVPTALPAQLQLIYGMPGLGVSAIAIILVVAALVGMPAGRRRIGAALLVMSLAPVVASIAVSMTIAPVFLVRTLVAVAVPMLLLIASAPGKALLTRALFGLLLVSALIRTVQVQRLPPEQDWHAVVRWIAPKMGPGDVIYAYPNEGALPLRYGLRDLGATAAIRELPGPVPSRDPQGWYPTGSRGVQSLLPARIAAIADDEASRRAPVIWLMRINTRYYDKGDAALKVFAQRRNAIATYNRDAIDIVGFARRAPPPER